MKNKFFISIVFVFYITNIQAQCNLSLSLSNKQSTCGNCDGTINSYVSNGTAPYTYNWTGPNGFTSTADNIVNLCPGNYSLTVTDAVNCTATITQLLTEDIFTSANWPINFVNTNGDEDIQDMVTDPDGNVYAIGTFTNDITFGTIPTFTNTGTSGSKGIFVVKLNYCGVVQQARYYGNVWEPNLHIERLASSGLIVIAGEFFGNIDFTGAGNPMTAVDANDGFLATLDPNTLYCNANQQVHIYSNYDDIINGLSVTGVVYVSGGFRGAQLQFSNSATVLTNVSADYDIFLCRFNCTTTSANFSWAKNYPNLYSGAWADVGMTMQATPTTMIYFTYQYGTSSTNRVSYIARVSASSGNNFLNQQIGSGTQFFNIYDMVVGSNGYLYLCGYYKSSYTASTKKATVFYYPAPGTSIVLDPNNVRLSIQTSTYNEATKLVTNGSNIFVSGTYDYTGFQIGYSTFWSQPPATLYGTIDHFVYKTDATLTPASYWLSGVASTTTNVSKGNTLTYDGTNNVYYLGGMFNGNLKFTGALGQTISPYAGYDGYIGRFVDNGLAEFKRLSFFNDTTSKVLNSNISVYPNPANTKITITSLSGEDIMQVSISDITGRIVYSKNNEMVKNEINTDVSFLQSSTYFITVTTSSNRYNQKLVIVK